MSISNLSPPITRFTYDIKLDACHLACPLPLLKTKQSLAGLAAGQTLWVISNQPSLTLDIKTLLRQTGDELLAEFTENNVWHFFILKSLSSQA